MATSKPKDSSTTTHVGKKALTPSNSHTRISTTTTDSTQKASSSSLASTDTNNNQKQVPNYLKPTLSSRPNSFKHHKNQDSHSNKPTLNRRRSFDKPPSASGSSSISAQKASAAADKASPALRNSSSFSSKTTTTTTTTATTSSSSLRTLSSKTTPRAAKPRTLYAKSAKKSTEFFVKRKEKGPIKSTACSSTEVNNLDDQVFKVDDDQDQLHEVTSPADELIKSEDNVNHDDDVSDHDHGQEQGSDEVNELNTACDISTVSEVLVLKADHDHPDANSKIGGYEETSNDEHNKLETDQEEEQEEIKPGGDHDNDHSDQLAEEQVIHQEKLPDDDHVEGTNNIAGEDDHHQGAKADDNHDDQVVVSKEEDANKANEEVRAIDKETGDDQENKVTNIGDDHDNQKEGEEEEEVAKPAEASAGPGPASAVAKRHGKKESQAYNDVIEETASKLLEKRKNKVKALVGAFETVIDYESAAK
ncbi:Calmodulin-binding domain [Parasponia andersonii]|uniref:Calmodulin-binding domain n=1 Tax=Parasponia andersonii TaxID=3476 RepID=A0A2P5DIF9_PARAD|nr:Calmodulin-binding domain [Parasponia andersonii]